MPRQSPAQLAVPSLLKVWKARGVSIEDGIQALLCNSKVAKKLQEAELDYEGALIICHNARRMLGKIKYSERYSGARKTILAAALGGISIARLRRVLEIGRKAVKQASLLRITMYDNAEFRITQPTALVLHRKSVTLKEYITQWVIDNSTPSSNTRNTMKIKNKDGTTTDVVFHWRTETLLNLYARCRLEVAMKFYETFRHTFFRRCIPEFVRLKIKQEGLCPIHHTGITLQKELKRKRKLWHLNCSCECDFCSSDGCNHGKSPATGNCSLFTCERCADHKCPKEWCLIPTNWLRPITQKRVGGGLYWTNEVYSGTRKDMRKTMEREMKSYNTHADHVIYHKQQVRHLLENLKDDQIVIKADFIQNILHARGRETSASHYGKRQTQLLSFVVWYKFRDEHGEMKLGKVFIDYLSSYLKHNSLFFQKCVTHLLDYLRQDMNLTFNKVWFDTDGGKAHFKSRISFFFASTLPALFGIVVHWIFDPSNHGKGECDSHGAVVKKGIKLFVLDDDHHVDDENEAVDFINENLRNSYAFLMDVDLDEMEQDCTPVTGSNSIHEFRFCGSEGEVLVRRLPCFCSECMEENYAECENLEYVGQFTPKKMKKLAMRSVKARYHDGEKEPQEGEENLVVHEIHGSRIFESRQQYSIEWEGDHEIDWYFADDLDCIEAIEQYEINQN